MAEVPLTRKRRTKSRDWGRIAAFGVCVLFAIVGAVPLSLGLLVRTEMVRAWAAKETAHLLERELGIVARYQVSMQALPLIVRLDGLTVDATDGGSPFLFIESVAIRPRIFSLLAGQLDAGDIEITGPRVRAVIEGRELKNLRYKLPELSESESKASSKTPFGAVTITDAHIDASIDSVRVFAREVDVDVSAEDGGAFEMALRVGPSRISRMRAVPGRDDEDAVDDDMLCRLDTRIRIERDSVLVRRFSANGAVDLDADADTTPSCTLAEGDLRAFEISLSALRIQGIRSGEINAGGRAKAQIPMIVLTRIADIPYAAGMVHADVEIDYDGKPGLPRITGRLEAEKPSFDGKIVSRHFTGELSAGGDQVLVRKIESEWAEGKAFIRDVKVEPFAEGIPLTAHDVDLKDLEFTALLQDLGAHPTPWVTWSLYEGHVDTFKGTLSPLKLEGLLGLKTRNFEVFDRPAEAPGRLHRIGVKEATVQGSFQVHDNAVVLSNFEIATPNRNSHLHTTVRLGFESILNVQVYEGTSIDLAEISPLTELPIAGRATIKAGATGPFTDPAVTGDVSVKNFEFAGFSAGDIDSAHLTFKPSILNIHDARLRKNESRYRVTAARVNLEGPAAALLDMDVDTRDAQHLLLKDFYKILHLDDDPRFADYSAVLSGVARIHYSLGGPEDRCGGGFLSVRTEMDVSNVVAFDELFESGHIDLSLIWDDKEASSNGMRMELREALLRKGTGSVIATGGFQHGGAIQITALASGIPIANLNALKSYGRLFDGSVSATVTVGGTLAQMSAEADVRVSRIRMGPAILPSSDLRVLMEPVAIAPKTLGLSRCGHAKPMLFDKTEFEKDLAEGRFRITGDMFGGQIALSDVLLSRQRNKVVSGKINVRDLDIGAIANVVPGVAFAGAPPKGTLSARLDIGRFAMNLPQTADATIVLDGFTLERAGQRVRLTKPSEPIALKNNEIKLPEMLIEGKTASGLTGTVRMGGHVHKVMTRPDVDVTFAIDPIDLSKAAADIPQIERASGAFDAKLRVSGPISAPSLSGLARLRKGALRMTGFPLGFDELELDVAVGGGDVRLTRASALVGGGTLSMTGRLPVRGLEVGTASFTIEAKGVKVPVAEGVNLTADANLEATFAPGASVEGERNLPFVKGTIGLTSFSYTRPIAMSVNIGQLTGKPKRTEVESYDPNGDFVRFSLNVVTPKPMRFSNNLIDMQLEVAPPALLLSGTNQRFGARGLLKILPDSKLTLQNSEFSVREGYVRFDDENRIAPKVDVRAATEYRRYARSGETSPQDQPVSSAASLASQGGTWRINMRASGEVDNLNMSLTSDPPLSQEDIVLLLAMGVTRAELEQGFATTLGSTVGIEAISRLTGADKALKTMVPLVDEFRFGSGYSSKTGRTGPTVTVGKRITDEVRAGVTTGLTENREVRSNVEWKLGRGISVQGSYDNANDASSSVLGNVGVDLRWRLEFE